jgi:hypothetical protein
LPEESTRTSASAVWGTLFNKTIIFKLASLSRRTPPYNGLNYQVAVFLTQTNIV